LRIGFRHRRIRQRVPVGCGQLIYIKDKKIIDIEGDSDSPISRCLCPKGAATFQLVSGSHRIHNVLYRRPHGTEWEVIALERAMGIAHLGGARCTWEVASIRRC
jgi:anaerobic selenocysteine-containing dehydrogenase